MNRRDLLKLAAAGTAASWLGPARAQQRIELRVSHFLPPTHGIHTDFLVPWARELETRTGGRVAVTIFAGDSSLGKVENQYDQVRSGVVDIAHGLHGSTRGRFPRTGLIELPFLTESAAVASRTLWNVYPRQLLEEYRGFKVLALHAHNGGLIHTRDKQIASLQDLQGLRVRSPTAPVAAALAELGAVPVTLPAAAAHDALRDRAIDGAVFPWDPVKSLRLDEVTRYHLDARFYTVSFFFLMNQRRYDALPAEVRQAIDGISGEPLVARFGDWWNAWDLLGLEAARARGNVVTRLSEDDRRLWRQRLQPVIDQQLGALEAQGVAEARQVYLAMIQEIARLKKPPQPPGIGPQSRVSSGFPRERRRA